MTTLQKVIKYLALGFAAVLVLGIICGVAGVVRSLTGLLIEDSVSGEVYEENLTGEIKTLDVSISGAELTITTGDVPSVKVVGDKITVKNVDGHLKIKEKNSLFHATNANKTIVVVLPASLDSVSIETGAGKLNIEGIEAHKLELSLGAGNTVLKNVTVSGEAQIEGGVGALEVIDSTVRDMDLDMGIGNVSIKAALLGESKFSCGIGDFDLTLTGGKDTYTLDIDKGVGNVTVDGTDVHGSYKVGNGSGRVDIDCGVGSVTVVFE